MKWLGVNAAIALVLTILLECPFVAIIPGVLAFPLVHIWPAFGTTGSLVEVGFAWTTIKHVWVGCVFFAYYFLTFAFPVYLVTQGVTNEPS